MRYNPDIHHRHSIRMKNFDYSSNGRYFITICTQDREKLFGEVVGANPTSPRVQLNSAGKMIAEIWNQIIDQTRNITVDKYVLMPNHFHCLLSILRTDMESTPTVGMIIQSFKRYSTIEYIASVKSGEYPAFNKRIWQRNYYEHIIRSEDEYHRIWSYIDENPIKWQEDDYYM